MPKFEIDPKTGEKKHKRQSLSKALSFVLFPAYLEVIQKYKLEGLKSGGQIKKQNAKSTSIITKRRI